MHINMKKQLEGSNFSGKENNNGKRFRKPNVGLSGDDVAKQKKGSLIILILRVSYTQNISFFLFIDARTILERPKPQHALSQITQYAPFNTNIQNNSSTVTGNSQATTDHCNSNFGKRIFYF